MRRPARLIGLLILVVAVTATASFSSENENGKAGDILHKGEFTARHKLQSEILL